MTCNLNKHHRYNFAWDPTEQSDSQYALLLSFLIGVRSLAHQITDCGKPVSRLTEVDVERIIRTDRKDKQTAQTFVNSFFFFCLSVGWGTNKFSL